MKISSATIFLAWATHAVASSDSKTVSTKLQTRQSFSCQCMDSAFSRGGCSGCGFDSDGYCLCDTGPYGALACNSAILACSANSFAPCDDSDMRLSCKDYIPSGSDGGPGGSGGSGGGTDDEEDEDEDDELVQTSTGYSTSTTETADSTTSTSTSDTTTSTTSTSSTSTSTTTGTTTGGGSRPSSGASPSHSLGGGLLNSFGLVAVALIGLMA